MKKLFTLIIFVATAAWWTGSINADGNQMYSYSTAWFNQEEPMANPHDYYDGMGTQAEPFFPYSKCGGS